MTGMFAVEHNFIVYDSVVEDEDGRWFDGSSREDVTGGKLLGKQIGSHYDYEDGITFYYRNGDEIYQHTPDGEYRWFCAASVADAFENVWS